jgi:fatty-acyl-CoA synthase
MVVYTSGTTGRPKGAVLGQAAMRANAEMSHHAYAMTPDDLVLNILPLFHVGGLNIQPLPALLAGAGVVIHDGFDPAAVLAAIGSQRITQMTVVPTILGALLGTPEWQEADLSSLRMMAIGSTDVPVALIEAVHARGVPVVQVYGATETSPTAIYQTADIATATVGSIGRAGSRCEIRITGEDGAELPVGEVGEIRVRGDNILTRYWNNESASTESIVDGWFRTGDMARVDADGLYWFADRLKHVIISGGENIYPAELERVLADFDGLTEFAIVGRDDPRWGQVPVVVAARSGPSVTGDDVLAHFEGRIARFKRPKDVVFVEALPRNALGKVVAANVRALL